VHGDAPAAALRDGHPPRARARRPTAGSIKLHLAPGGRPPSARPPALECRARHANGSAPREIDVARQLGERTSTPKRRRHKESRYTEWAVQELLAKRPSLLVAMFLATVNVDCAADDGDDVDGSIVDAAPRDVTEIDVFELLCNPISQTGCADSKKCTYSFNDPAPTTPGCWPEGSRARGESCAIDPATGIDDCARGLLCHDGSTPGTTCSELCNTVVGGCSEGTCTPVAAIGDETAGVCVL